MEIKDRELHRIVTTAVIYKPDFTYLIMQRALHKKSHPGKWSVPGGGLSVDDYLNTPHSEHGENLWYNVLDKSLKREIKEEADIEIGKPELVVDMTFIRPDGIPVICFSCMAPYVSGEVNIDQDKDKDNIAFAWVTLEEAKNYDLIGGVWDEIRQVNEILKNRKKG
jgi:8-oxo-dGTP pyrophosphatase MutT (NUDIX family)